ncbi:tellurite resistance TerB family protein [Zestomonas carbonaria]|uniref:Tellurite resistance TerB family protein n=1 Tax=Zestomonas carbonaria TaxID=2762745 RepID=A0A7U7ENW4_9GAMM|nr:tellurite resistance TerB family protein [Pseudomonas carbonaria]CAD5107525.1 hypothetical protein PSEWESI4_01798 [Pseudomonas carbonaria]
MNTRGLLDQLLKSGQELLQNGGGQAKSGQGGQLGNLLGSVGGGALGGGAIALLLGSKKARKMSGKVLTYGGLAALGVVAYKAYNNWQQQQQAGAARTIEPQTVDRLPAPQAEQHSHAILRALVAAAKSDGHIDARERQLIDDEVLRITGDRELQGWLDRELNKPLDPAEVASAAQSPEMAAEMYLASLLMVDQEHFMERAYLDELARQLKLDPALKSELETQARQVL